MKLKRQCDTNQLAKNIVDLAIGDKRDPNAVALGRKGGLIGGKARAANMTPEERTTAARKAAIARWKKERENGNVSTTTTNRAINTGK